MRKFKFKTSPYQHQLEALSFAYGRKAFAFFMEMGTGKSKIIVDEVTNLIEDDLIDASIILAPNNIHAQWKSEFIKHGPDDYDKWAIQIYRSTENEEKRDELTQSIINSGKKLILLVNIEALSTDKGYYYLHKVLKSKLRCYLAIDESHKIKSYSAKRTKNAILLSRLASIKRIATGTEAEEGLENLFSQFKFLDPGIIGINSYTAFRYTFCIMGGFEGREVKGYQNQDVLAARIKNFAYQKRKYECLDLPEKVYVTHEIGITRPQMKIYDQLRDELIYELENNKIVDATMAITKMIRLQQVLCGHLNASDHESRLKPEIIPSVRASYVADLVDNISGKVIIFCRFVMDVNLVSNALGDAGIKSIAISGGVDPQARMDEIDRWRVSSDTKALVMTIATGGVGLTLNEANNTIFYSNTWSSTDRLQAEDRNHRIGQNDKVTYHDIVVPGRIDEKLLTALREKRALSQEFRNLMKVINFLKNS